MTLVLHHCHETRSMRVLWLLNELGLDFELVVHPFGRALRDPDYLAVSPLGRVPCLVDDGRSMTESLATIEYLCETRDDRGLFRGPGDPERFDWLQWLHFSETMAVHVAAVTQQLIALNDPALRSPTIIKLETRRMEKALGVLDERLAGRDYVLTSGLSAADIAIGWSIHGARLFTPLDAFPNVAAYYRRLAARPAFQASLPAPDAPDRLYTQDRYFEVAGVA